MRFGKLPFLLLYLVIVLWYSLPDDGEEVRTPRYDPPPREPIATPKDGETLPPPSFRDPTFQVENNDPQRNSSGTAFAIDRDGLWITARHVVDGCTRLGFLLPDGRRAYGSQQVWIHPNSDMALVQGPETVAAVELTQHPSPSGADAFHIGYPQGKPADVWSQVIGRARMVTRGRYRITEPVVAYAEVQRFPSFTGSLGGMSGGPIFNNEGRIIGITVAGNPRRGRVIGTAPRSFDRLFKTARRMPGMDNITAPPIDSSTLAATGKEMRRRFVVAKLICRVS